ncbi:type II toxin-antitoxin system RelE/ParE family toxin [Roseibium sp.]|uniref:type II toxin-antitoxin system RelE/ParE family toxin n=1 Tax=Roseibium sp. TaxID=1936156 RepID=UPI003D146F61
MTSPKPTHYRLTPAAEHDLEDIWQYTARNWSEDQADSYVDALEGAFNTLLAMPEIARERTEFNPPVRIHPSAQHAIIYRVQGDHIVILRVLGGRQDWKVLLEE